MQDKDNKLIWEQYNSPGGHREYGPSGAPSLDISSWEVADFYTVDEWEHSTGRNPWVKYANQVIDDLRDGRHPEEVEFLVFFYPRQGSTDYEAWTDPGIAVAFDNISDYSNGIFVDNDGEGEAHMLAPEIVRDLVKVNLNTLDSKMREVMQDLRSQADSERYADRFAPFDSDY